METTGVDWAEGGKDMTMLALWRDGKIVATADVSGLNDVEIEEVAEHMEKRIVVEEREMIERRLIRTTSATTEEFEEIGRWITEGLRKGGVPSRNENGALR